MELAKKNDTWTQYGEQYQPFLSMINYSYQDSGKKLVSQSQIHT